MPHRVDQPGKEMAEVISFPERSRPDSAAKSWPGTLIDLQAAREMAGLPEQDPSTADTVEAPESDQGSSARQIALRSLAVRGRSVAEVRHKLRDKGVDEVVVDAEIERLIAEGLLDDYRLAENLQWTLRENKKLGPVAIRQALVKRKIPVAIIDQVVSSSTEDHREDIESLVESRYHSLAGLERDVQVRRLVGYLARRGYTGPDVYRVVNALL